MDTQIKPRLSSGFLAQRKNLYVTLVSLSVLCLATAVTNPNQTAYVDYASRKFIGGLKENCDELESRSDFGFLSFSNRDTCKTITGIGVTLTRGAVEYAIDFSTERDNFGLFSIYTTEIYGERIKTVGVLNRFFTI